jgi:hypothetical protein
LRALALRAPVIFTLELAQMPYLSRIATAFGLAMALCQAFAQPAPPAAQADGMAAYMRALDASKFVENYQASAVVSARVFGARAQGSDKEYAEYMGYVATTDLSDAKPCLAKLVSLQGFTPAEADEVTAVYLSDLGPRIIEASRKLIREAIEHGRAVPASFEGWSVEDKQRLAVIYQTPSFRSFHMLAARRSFMEGTIACYKTVLSAKHPGVKF